MFERVKIERETSDITSFLGRQKTDPLRESKAIDDFLVKSLETVDLKTVSALLFIGYIEGKRAERARRKRQEGKRKGL